MPLHPRTCSLLYSISCLLDALDGYAARYFEQSTKFGAVLDMVTDRCTTSCLLVFLSSAFPRWAIVFQGLISIDFASHYMHMYATLAMGGSDTSHKNVDKSRSWLLNLYYTNKVCSVLFTRITMIRCLPVPRPFSSRSAPSTNSSSSAYTYSLSPRRSYRPSCSSPSAMSKPAPSRRGRKLTAPCSASCSPTLIARALLRWHVLTRWIRPGLGLLPESAPPSWH